LARYSSAASSFGSPTYTPGMDGYELAERATRLRSGLKVLQLSG